MADDEAYKRVECAEPFGCPKVRGLCEAIAASEHVCTHVCTHVYAHV